MEKYLCWGSMGTAGLLLVLFTLDLVMGIPFGTLNKTVDIVSILACCVIGYLAWEAYRDLR